MRPRDHELRSALAAEYSLGTLIGGARSRFERLLESDPALRGEVEAWDAVLLRLLDRLPERAPPGRVWSAVRARTGTAPVRPRLRDRLGLWRLGTALATACALVLAVLLVVERPAPAPPPAPARLAVVADAGGRGAWLVSVDPSRRRVTVRSLAPRSLAPDRSFELWLLPGAGAAPRSLGLVPPDGVAVLPLPAALAPAVPAATGVAVSLEPAGGSPTGAPTGPVLYQGALVSGT